MEDAARLLRTPESQGQARSRTYLRTLVGLPPRTMASPRYADLFTDRQLVALTTFSDLVAKARSARRWLADALAAGMDADALRLADGGTGAQAYADAVATYLGLGW